MLPPRPSTERHAGRRRRDAVLRRVTAAGAWVLALALALPVLDLVRRAAPIHGAFVTGSDSMQAMTAGMGAAAWASLLALLPVLLVALPAGIAVAVYLEEIARPGRLVRGIKWSVGQLALLPPVVFGLLGFGGLVVVFGLPVGTPLLAGAVLGLMILPRMVLASQFVLRRVPRAVRNAGYAMGASPLRVVVEHVLPRALPSLLSAACIGLARALGEVAPLLMVGFLAFAAGWPAALDEPGIPLAATVYRWGTLPAAAFAAKAAAAGLLLLAGVLALGMLAARLEKQEARS